MNKKNIRTSARSYLIMLLTVITIITAMFGLTGCVASTKPEAVELTILAAASLTDVCNEIKSKYEAENENVKITFSYGGSGALQTQIEEGAPADIFMPASIKQMNTLDEKGLMVSESVTSLLENKVVLIVPNDSTLTLDSFEGVAGDEVRLIGLGEVSSVPVGQYAEEIFTNLGILEQVTAKANYGTDARTVLSWVETGVVDCGVVYATDAMTTESVRVICNAPEVLYNKVIYPVGIIKASTNPKEAQEFLDYLKTDEIMKLFEKYGFSEVY